MSRLILNYILMFIIKSPDRSNNEFTCAAGSLFRADAMKNGALLKNNTLSFDRFLDPGNMTALDLERIKTQVGNMIVPLSTDHKATLKVEASQDMVVYDSSFKFTQNGKTVKSPFRSKEYFCTVQSGDKFEIAFNVVPCLIESHTVDVSHYKLVPDSHLEIEFESSVDSRETIYINTLQRIRNQTVRFREIIQKTTVVKEGKDPIKHTWVQRIDPYIHHIRLAQLFCLVMNESPDVTFASYTVKQNDLTMVMVSTTHHDKVLEFVESWLSKHWKAIFSKK